MNIGAYLSEELDGNVVAQQESVSSPLLFATVNDVATNKVKVGIPYDIMYADYVFLIVLTIF